MFLTGKISVSASLAGFLKSSAQTHTLISDLNSSSSNEVAALLLNLTLLACGELTSLTVIRRSPVHVYGYFGAFTSIT